MCGRDQGEVHCGVHSMKSCVGVCASMCVGIADSRGCLPVTPLIYG